MERYDARLVHQKLRGRVEQYLPDRLRREPLSQHCNDDAARLLHRHRVERGAKLAARAGIIATFLPGGWDLVQPFAVPAPRSVGRKIVAGRIRLTLTIQQRGHRGAQYGLRSGAAAEQRHEAVSVADGDRFVANLPEIARPV